MQETKGIKDHISFSIYRDVQDYLGSVDFHSTENQIEQKDYSSKIFDFSSTFLRFLGKQTDCQREHELTVKLDLELSTELVKWKENPERVVFMERGNRDRPENLFLWYFF